MLEPPEALQGGLDSGTDLTAVFQMQVRCLTAYVLCRERLGQAAVDPSGILSGMICLLSCLAVFLQ